MRASKQTRSTLSDCTRRGSDPTLHVPCKGKALLRGYIIIYFFLFFSLKECFRSHWKKNSMSFTETNVQKCIKPKQSCLSLLSRTLLCSSVPKKQIRLKGADVPSCLCHIKEGNSNNMQRNQSHRASPCAKATPPNKHLLHPRPPSLPVSMVQPSHRVHVSWQRLADSGPKEEKRGEWITASDLNLSVFAEPV